MGHASSADHGGCQRRAGGRLVHRGLVGRDDACGLLVRNVAGSLCIAILIAPISGCSPRRGHFRYQAPDRRGSQTSSFLNGFLVTSSPSARHTAFSSEPSCCCSTTTVKADSPTSTGAASESAGDGAGFFSPSISRPTWSACAIGRSCRSSSRHTGASVASSSSISHFIFGLLGGRRDRRVLRTVRRLRRPQDAICARYGAASVGAGHTAKIAQPDHESPAECDPGKRFEDFWVQSGRTKPIAATETNSRGRRGQHKSGKRFGLTVQPMTSGVPSRAWGLQ